MTKSIAAAAAGLSCVVATMLGALVAEANIAAPGRYPQARFATATAGKTPLVVDSETLVFRCSAGDDDNDGGPRCRFVATYQVSNPTAERVDQTAAFVSIRTPLVKTTVDGEDAAHHLSADELKTIAALDLGLSSAAGLHGMRFSLDPGQRSTIVSEGVTLPTHLKIRSHGWAVSGNRGRHLVLGSDDSTRRPKSYHFGYSIAPIHTWASVGTIDIEIHYDDRWELRGGVESKKGRIPFSHDAAGVARVELTSSERGSWLSLSFRDVPLPIYNGGPVAAIGGVVGDDAEMRARFGYEFATPDWLVHSVSVDTDFDDHVIITPAVEAVSPHLLFIFPSFGAGLGVPVRVRPDTQLGVRAQATVSYFPVGFVMSVDVFPGADEDDKHGVDVSLMARLSM